MASYYLSLCVTLYLTFHPSHTATVERQLGYSQGTDFATNFNDGSYVFFPDTPSVADDQYRYFAENMDFDTVDGKLLLGSADKLYLFDMNLSTAENGILDWPSANISMTTCESSNLVTNSIIPGVYLCRNHIRLYQRVPYAPDLLFVCGTESGQTPQCRAVNVSNNEFGYAAPPSDTTNNIVSSNPDYPNLGDFRRSSANDTAYLSWSYQAEGTTNPYYFDRQTVTYNSSQQKFTNTPDFGLKSLWIDTPATVVDIIPLSFTIRETQSDRNHDFYFVFLRERHQFTLENTLDTEPLVLSRVLRICRDDPGLNIGGMDVFSTFYKARIYCNQESPGTGNNPLGAVDNHYNDLWSVAINGDGGRSFPTGPYNVKLYGAFSTPLTGPTGTAICAYTVTPSSAGGNSGTLNRGIFDTFLEDISQENPPDAPSEFTERENNFGFCDGNGRPLNPASGVGAEDILVSRAILQIGVDPLIVFDDFYVTKLVVDEACVVESNNRHRCINQDVLFAGTNTGKIVKVVFGRNGSTTVPVVSEEITLDDPRFVKDIDIKEVDGMKFIFATTQSHVYKISVERCNRHKNYSDCIGARDAYCAWNTVDQECQYLNITADASSSSVVPTYLLQNIHLGEIVDNMPTIGIEMDTYTVDESNGTVSVTITGDGGVPGNWVELDLITTGTVPEVLSNQSVVIMPPANSTIIEFPIPVDNKFTGPRVFTLQLRNTIFGAAIFTRREANLTVIDGDGIYGQIGLKYTAGSCLDIEERKDILLQLDKAIMDATKGTIYMQDFTCEDLKAVYRFILTVSLDTQVPRLSSRQTTTTTAQLVASLRSWVILEETFKASGAGKSIVEVDSSCNVNVTSLDQSLCSFMVDNAIGGLEDGSLPATALAGIFALLFGIAVGVCVCLIIIIIIIVNKQKKSSFSPEKVYYGKNSLDRSSPTQNPEASYVNVDITKEDPNAGAVQTSLTSSSSSGSQRSPQPIDSLNSAAPLMQNGVETKKSPFNFVPFARKNSPSVAHDGPRMSLDSPRSGKRKSVDSMVDSGTPKDSGVVGIDSPTRSGSAGGRVLLYDTPTRGTGGVSCDSPLKGDSRVTSASYSTTSESGNRDGLSHQNCHGITQVTVRSNEINNSSNNFAV